MKEIIKKFLLLFEKVGDFTLFSLQAFKYMFVPPYRTSLTIYHLHHIGLASIVIISISNLAIGMIFGLQIGAELNKFSAQELTPNVLAQALAREMAPVITALMLISKNGSAFTAEIGSMKSNEQLDALKTMAVNPIHYLVSPRLFSCIIMFPILTALANIVGILGGFVIILGLLDINFAFAVDHMFNKLTPADIITGLVKSLFMGIAVCLICCYQGFNANIGSQGVGNATTKAVVNSSIAILIIDLILGQLFLIINLVN